MTIEKNGPIKTVNDIQERKYNQAPEVFVKRRDHLLAQFMSINGADYDGTEPISYENGIESHYRGLLGEIVVANFLDTEMQLGDGEKAKPNGDINFCGVNIDVKFSNRSDMLVKAAVAENCTDTDVYMMVRFEDNNTAKILGWRTAEYVSSLRTNKYPRHKRNKVVHWSDLHSMREFFSYVRENGWEELR